MAAPVSQTRSLTRLALQSATYHWRTNLAAGLGMAAAVAVLGGALLVGDSVRGSLRDLALSRLGRTGHAVSSAGFFREALADDLAGAARTAAVPLIAASGFVTHEPSGRRASSVLVYGVDERFWRFHGLEPRDGVFVSPALGAELTASSGDVLLTRLQRPTEIPLESLFAQKADVARTVRLTVTGVLGRGDLGEFSLQPQQAEVRALFAPLRRLQRDLGVGREVNTILVADNASPESVEPGFRAALSLEDLGIRLEAAADGSSLIIESAGGVIREPLSTAATGAARALDLRAMPVFTYLANTIRIGEREIPYSLVTGIDLRVFSERRQPAAASGSVLTPADLGSPIRAPVEGSIVLNDWAARELNAAVGDRAQLEYYLWDAAAGLRTSTSSFTVGGIVPIAGLAADRRLVPEYPGITAAESLADWDPPFPVDLSRVRPQDEQYWREYRTTPKAFVSYEEARDLWATRYGQMTGLRLTPSGSRPVADLAEPLRERLRGAVTPASQGVLLVPVRRLALQGSSGATNFGEYFTYFSFFIVVSALLLTILFFRLGVEQRLRQIGILRAAGYTAAHIRRMLMIEAVVLALAGGVVGAGGAVAYAYAIVHGLRTWWVGAVGTTLLSVHISALSLIVGVIGGLLAALTCVLLSLRTVGRLSPRTLLGAHSLEDPAGAGPPRVRRARWLSIGASIGGLALLTLGVMRPSSQAAAFFGAGAALLIACLSLLASWLRGRDARSIAGRGPWAVSRLGFRGAAFRPGRSVLSAALIASAVFIIVSVDAFRRGGGELTTDSQSGTGGYVLLAKSDVPLVHDLNDPAGREALMIKAPEVAAARFRRFRMRPGEDASCLNLYKPGNPTIIAPEPSFLTAGRFAFASSLAETPEERSDPWLLLRRRYDDGAVPAIADATSLQYVLHASLGDTLTIDVGAATPLILRFVGALRDSVLQGELIIGEEHFVRWFPGNDGFRFFLVDAPDVRTREAATALAGVLERELQPFGLDAVSTVERLEAFHRVENTYLSTFQALGGLGLVLGTIGLATVMFRNVLERRRELALLRAVGYTTGHVTILILAETLVLLISGLAAGALCALVAIAPAWLARGGGAPGSGLALLLVGVVFAGIVSAAAATRAAVSGRLMGALRAD